MAHYERSTYIDAPFEDVWDFHSTEKGLVALTPGWLNIQLESVTGPDGESNPAVLETGAELVSSVKPLGVGPRQRWTSRIVARERSGAESGFFRDEMIDGPFASWVHTHRFEADDGGTRITDSIEYELPGGGLGRAVSPLAVVGFEPMFRYRHRRTHELLE
jgi:ligand-binding SRPBCC domain-containing protein